MTYQMNCGEPGCDTCASTPLARAINQLFMEGKPFSNLCQCYFKGTSDKLRWLGVFIQSAGNKLVYFPGFINEFDEIEGFNRTSLKWRQRFPFDHISLERDRSKWHMTSRHPRNHLGSPRTLPLGLNRFLFLGMSVRDANVMRTVKRETTIVFPSPPNDSKRRAEVFRKAVKGAKNYIISPNDENSVPWNERFLHFALIVGPKGFEDYSGHGLGFPYGSPHLAYPLPEELPPVPVRTHRMELSGNTDIQIIVCYLPGKLNIPVALTGY